MSFSDLLTSDLALVLPQFHTTDMYRKEGGYHTSILITSDVDSLFLPGIIVGSDASESVRYQHRKMFVKNLSNSHRYFVKVYGFNTKNNGVIKWALEKGQDQTARINGSEAIKDYLTAPSLYGSYVFTELNSDHAILVGSSGLLRSGQAQGVWLRQGCLKNSSDIASDDFFFGILWSELG